MALEFLEFTLQDFKIDPTKVVFNIANNHAGDVAGELGLQITAKNLSSIGSAVIGVAEVGLPGTATEKRGIMSIIEIKKRRIGIVSWTHWMNSTYKNNRLNVFRTEDVLNPEIK